VFSNTTAVDAYRGAGRPEACYVLERIVDAGARAAGIDVAEVHSPALPSTPPTGGAPVDPSELGLAGSAAYQLDAALGRYLADVTCGSLLPPCGDCADGDVLLASLELDDCDVVRICAAGREELRTLVGHVDLGLADSEFNRRELEAVGFSRTGVLPIYLDFARYREEPSPVLRRLLADGLSNVLFVGRVAPNKRQEDLVRLASYWKRFISPDVRLLLVGKLPRRRHYFDALQSFLYEEGFTPWEVVFTGHVDHQDLLAYYASAHVFVSMSDHEGFGVPLVEAMLMDVPIVAYRTTAVGDTLGDAGVQFGEKDLAAMAETAHRLAKDDVFKSAVLEGQRARLAAFAPTVIESTLRTYIDGLQA